MEKKLSDYLHLYLGCEMICVEAGAGGDLKYEGRIVKLTANRLCFSDYLNVKVWKPILRPLSDMTEEERNAHRAIQLSGKFKNETEMSAELMRWLLSKQFDLFGLIESGLAIDKTKHS